MSIHVDLQLHKCVECGERYTEGDVDKYNFFLSTKTCYNCYRAGVDKEHTTWCFGKRNEKDESGKVVKWGYDPKATPCRVTCPDRKICRLFVEKVKAKRRRDGKVFVVPKIAAMRVKAKQDA